MASDNRPGIGELLADGQFVRVWLVGVCRGISQWLEMLVAGIFAFELTGSPFMVALLFIVRLAPLTVLGSIVGAIADRTSPRLLLLAGFVFACCVSGSVGLLLAAGVADYVVVLVASVAAGIVWTSDMPVRRRILGDVAGKDRLVAAMGLDAATNHATRVLGPLAGGLIYQFLGPAGAYLLTAALYLAAVILVATLTAGAGAAAPRADRPRLAKQLREGFAFSLRNRDVLRFLLVTIAFNVWAFPFVTMIPVIGSEQLELSPGWIGALAAMEGAGAFVGCLVLAMGIVTLDPRRAYFFGTVLYMAFAFTAGLMAHALPMALVLVCIGLGMSGFSTMQSTLVFQLAPPEMRSRLFGVIVICIGTGLIGVANMGLMGEWLGGAGAVRLVAAEGIAALVIIAAGWKELWERRR
jgi:MFS family permease